MQGTNGEEGGGRKEVPHGFVTGAVEMSEAPIQLAMIDPTGRLELLDLITEKAAHVGDLGSIGSVSTDGRYVFSSSAAGVGVTITDTGAWTVDHDDHFHYYSAEPRIVGTVAGQGPGIVHTNASVALIAFPETGSVTVLDYPALGTGVVTELRRLGPGLITDAAVPLGAFVLAGVAGAGGVTDIVRAYDETGADVAEAECARLDGTVATRVGVVFGCADGAVLATVGEAGIAFERIPYPHAVDENERARDFRNRAGRPVVAAPAGERGAWILDTRARRWHMLPTEVPLAQISAVDNADNHAVAITVDGAVLVLDTDTGQVRAETDLILASSLEQSDLAAGIELTVDANRAYVNAPAENAVYEIDYADGARIARTFSRDAAPSFTVQTGR